MRAARLPDGPDGKGYGNEPTLTAATPDATSGSGKGGGQFLEDRARGTGGKTEEP